MPRVRFDENDGARFHVHDFIVQFHVAVTFQDIVHLAAQLMVVALGIGDEGDVQVANFRVSSG